MFVGPATAYALVQTMGLFNEHGPSSHSEVSVVGGRSVARKVYRLTGGECKRLEGVMR